MDLHELDSADPQRKIELISKMGESRTARYIAPLIKVFADEVLAVRKAAEQALRRIDADWRNSQTAADMLPPLALMLAARIFVDCLIVVFLLSTAAKSSSA